MKKDHVICPICEEGVLSPQEREEVFPYKAKEVTAMLESSECSICGSEVITPEQARENQARIQDAKRASDGLLTSREIKAARGKLGLTQVEAAALFGGGPNAFSKYERGEITQSVTVDSVLRMAVEFPEFMENYKRMRMWRTATEHREKLKKAVHVKHQKIALVLTDETITQISERRPSQIRRKEATSHEGRWELEELRECCNG